MTKKQKQREISGWGSVKNMIDIFNRFPPRYKTIDDASSDINRIDFGEKGYEKARYEVQISPIK